MGRQTAFGPEAVGKGQGRGGEGRGAVVEGGGGAKPASTRFGRHSCYATFAR